MPTLFPLALALFGAHLPPSMVAYVDPQHGSLHGEISPIATSLVAWDGTNFEGSVGGGVRVAVEWRGFWPDYEESSEWAVELRVRALATHVALGGPDVEVPVDLLLRWGSVSFRTYTDTSGWPTEVHEPTSVLPYVGLGPALDVSTQHGLARGGLLVVGGVHWWIARQFGLVTEIEVRAIFGDVRPIGQLGGSLGIVIGL